LTYTLDADELSIREINKRLKQLSRTGAEIHIVNSRARHNIIVGLLDRCKITVQGSVGYYSASVSDGPEVIIEGNAGWALGENLMSGTVSVTRDAGASLAAGMRGGSVYVGGSAGARAGISMKGGTLLVRGNTGFLTGFMMQEGRIIVLGDAGESVGDSMYEGTIYVAGNIGSLGSDAKEEEASEDDLIGVWQTLEDHGIDQRPAFKKIVSARRLYHFDSLERLEMSAV
jgi:glutamate synthase domain-containing protein 3